MLVGRDAELARIAILLARAREGRSGALLLHGEAGIGKTALLEQAAEQADGLRILRTRGFEGESDIAFAGLLDLVHPLLDLRARVPPVQARALGAAFALEPPGGHDRFAVPAAVLTLLALAAEEGPVLVVADDVHWLDAASREALLFVARRLGAEGIALLLAARDEGGRSLEAAGVERVPIGALGARDARAVLAADLPAAVADQLVATASGNPLALREIPTLLTDAQRSGREPLPAPLPPGAGIEGAFSRQLSALPAETRRAVVVAAAMQAGRLDELFAALARMELDPAVLDAAEDAGVLELGDGEVRFRHPLLRSTAYHAATGTQRRRAHAVLAEVGEDPRRRAWHLAVAAVAPDEAVAEALEAAARDSRDRGGRAEAARAFARAADLSVDEHARVRRMLEGATDAIAAGLPDQALRLLDTADGATDDEDLLAGLRRLRGHVELRRGAPGAAYDLLEREARQLQVKDPVRAAQILIEASVAHMMTGDMTALMGTAERARDVNGGRDEGIAALTTILIGEALIALGRGEDGDALLRACEPVLTGGAGATLPEVIGMAGHASIWIEAYDRADTILGGLIRDARAASAVGLLIYPLAARAHLDFRRGRWSASYADAGEAARLARETGQLNLLAHSLAALAEVEIALGHAEDARAHAEESVAICRKFGSDATAVYAHAALGWEALTDGRVEQAIEHLQAADEITRRLGTIEPAIVQYAPDLVETLARAGRLEEAEAALVELERRAELTQRSWALAVAARCRGQLAPEDGFRAHFEAALVHHESSQQPFSKARTLLAYGERLRRTKQRAEAREPLQAALELFDRLGAVPWAERARSELRATGRTLRPREAMASDQLTAQELQIARLVADGLTNREVAAQLFLSPKTIEYHLSSTYRKLDVRSRTELTKLIAAEVSDPVAA